MIENEPGADWHDLQQRVATILVECGLAAEVGRSVPVARGTVKIDVYATDPTTTPPAVYLCECKRWRSRVPQAQVQAFRTVVSDAGAHFGLCVSAMGFQAGAFEVIKHTNVHLLGWKEFQKLFLERWCSNYWVLSCVCAALAQRGFLISCREDCTFSGPHQTLFPSNLRAHAVERLNSDPDSG